MPRNRFKVIWQCPFTRVELENLYWNQALTVLEITHKAQEYAGWSKVPNFKVAVRWMKEFGIPRRTQKQVAELNVSRGHMQYLENGKLKKKHDNSPVAQW